MQTIGNNKKSGFTVIELLVVVAIIAVLVSIVSTVVIAQVNRAKYTKAEADWAQFRKFLVVARAQAGKPAGQITGSYCSGCSCMFGDLRNISESSQCFQDWKHVLDSFQEAAGDDFSGIKSMLRDPWGSPYIFDEQDEEYYPACAEDYILTVGPDGVKSTGDDRMIVLPMFRCTP